MAVSAGTDVETLIVTIARDARDASRRVANLPADYYKRIAQGKEVPAVSKLNQWS